MTEACHILRRYPGAPEGCLHVLMDLRVEVTLLTGAAMPRLQTLLTKYRDAPMDFADARLVVLGEQLQTSRIFTLDLRHFLMYRLYDRESFEIVPRG